MENRETKTYPLLPLRGLIAFPNLPLSLDVGREKSVQALRAALEKRRFSSRAGRRPGGVRQHFFKVRRRAGLMGFP